MKDISVLLCDFACQPKGKIDVAQIAEHLSRNDLVTEVLRLPGPCTQSHATTRTIKGEKVLVVGCSFQRMAETTSVNPGLLLTLDAKSTVADLYDSQQDTEEALLAEISANLHILSAKEALPDDPLKPGVQTLVYGGGLSAIFAALELANKGIPVDMADATEGQYSPGCLAALLENPAMVSQLREQALAHPGIALLPTENGAPLSVGENGFAVGNGTGDSRTYGSVVFAPERVEEAAPFAGAYNLTSLYGTLQSRGKMPGTCVFLADYTSPTTAEVFRDILEAALFMQKTRYTSVWVLLRNAQVCAAGQETLYSSCREEGVLFVKYGQELAVLDDYGDFTLTGLDTQTGLPFQIHNPEFLVVPGIVTISDKAKVLAENLKLRLHENTYSQPDSLWRLPNESNIPGLFTAGAARGNMSLAGLESDASSAALSVLQRLSQDGPVVKEMIPVVDSEKCVYCLTCMRVCPFGAMVKNSKEGVVAVNASACQACGICIGECPAEALQMRNLGNETLYTGIHKLTS